MVPEQTTEEVELEPDRLDEKNCAEKVDYYLKKYGCYLHGQAILENGSVMVRVGIQKIPPEVRKEMKKAEKRGQFAS